MKKAQYIIGILLLVLLCLTACGNETDDPAVDPIVDPNDLVEYDISWDKEKHSWGGNSTLSLQGIGETEITEQKIIDSGNGRSITANNGENYFRFRNPQAVVTNNGTLLCFYTGATALGRADGADNDITHIKMARSTDLGKTWTKNVIFSENEVHGSMMPVIHRATNTIYLIGYKKDGAGPYRKLVLVSTDNGETWDEGTGAFCGAMETTYGEAVRGIPTKGISLPLQDGNDRPYFVSKSKGSGTRNYLTIGWLNDNKQLVPEAQATQRANEPTFVALEGAHAGKFLVIDRYNPFGGTPNTRRKQQCYFDLNNNTFTAWENSKLAKRTCQHGLMRYSGSKTQGGKKSRLLYSSSYGDQSSPSRFGGEIKVSYDEGGNWTSGKTVVDRSVHFAYSSMTILPDGSIALFYESMGDNETRHGAVGFKRFTMGWLTDGADLGWHQE